MKCSNCGSSIGCNCQQRTASDGKRCCSKCIMAYEKKLKQLKRSRYANR